MSSPTPTILIVENDPDVLMLAAFVLEDAGFQILEAVGADEALLLLSRNHDVALVFSDIQMPGRMNGIALAYQLHAEWENLPVLLTSAHSFDYYEDYPCGIPFLSKPYDRQTLLAIVSDTMHAA